MARPRICVVGSANLDMNCYVERFPAPGETLHGRRFTTGFGGKGANQAVMAARLGAAVAMVSRVGRDTFGEQSLAAAEHDWVQHEAILINEVGPHHCAQQLPTAGQQNVAARLRVSCQRATRSDR